MQIEIEGEQRQVDEEKLERLVKYEDAVQNDEVQVSDANTLTFGETLAEHFPSVLARWYPAPISGVVYDVDVDDPDTPRHVTLHYKYRGDTYSQEYRTSSEEYANILNYLDLRPYEILDVPGKRVPIDLESGYHRNDITPPENTATWANYTFKTIRLLVRFGFLEKAKSHKKEEFTFTNRTFAWSGLLQLFVFLGCLVAFVPASFLNSESVFVPILATAFLVSISVSLLSIAVLFYGGYKKVARSFGDFKETDAWPL